MEAIILRSALLSIKTKGDGGLLDRERQGAKYSQNIPLYPIVRLGNLFIFMA
jgi:hypothetical protein